MEYLICNKSVQFQMLFSKKSFLNPPATLFHYIAKFQIIKPHNVNKSAICNFEAVITIKLDRFSVWLWINKSDFSILFFCDENMTAPPFVLSISLAPRI